MRFQLIKLALASLFITACDGSDMLDPADSTQTPGAKSTEAEPRLGVLADVKIQVKEINGVDAFLRTEVVTDGPEEGFSGYPVIQDGCLFLNSEDGVKVVVWPKGSEKLAQKLISQAKAEDKTPVSLGGDDISIDEFKSKTSDHPSKCKIESVFVVTPD